MSSYTFNDLITEVLRKSKTSMTSKDIWKSACEMNLDKKIGSYGKTPWATIGARIYTEIKDNSSRSVYIQASKRPCKFTLRDLSFNLEQIDIVVKKMEDDVVKSKFHERDLHPILAKYVFENPHFKCNVKTIFHENSTKKIKGLNEWLHPDLVGVYFPFDEYSLQTLELQKHFNVNSIKLFAFEMKIQLTFSNFRQSFFQAVSNASWANEGYLVSLKIDEDPVFKNEIQRLSNAFGIGVIKLAEIVSKLEILFPAKKKDMIDWDTVNRLADDSPDFRKFCSDLAEDVKLSKIKSNYDKIYKDGELVEYLKQKKILD